MCYDLPSVVLASWVWFKLFPCIKTPWFFHYLPISLYSRFTPPRLCVPISLSVLAGGESLHPHSVWLSLQPRQWALHVCVPCEGTRPSSVTLYLTITPHISPSSSIAPLLYINHPLTHWFIQIGSDYLGYFACFSLSAGIYALFLWFPLHVHVHLLI